MTTATHILQRPAQFQWDADSYPCKPDNCNPTSVAMVAGFYKDRRVSPTGSRRLMQGGSTRCGPTNFGETVRGLNALGVPSTYGWLSVSGVKSKVNAGIPVIISMDYSKLPNHRAYQTDFGFNGWHAVVVCKVVTQKDHLGRLVPGVLVRDPDHASPARPERPASTFWPDWVWVKTYVRGSSGGISAWPKYKKVIPATTATDPISYVKKVAVTADSLSVRTGPGPGYPRVASLSKGKVITTTKLHRSGGSYSVNGVSNNDWLGYTRDGKTAWIARGYTKLV